MTGATIALNSVLHFLHPLHPLYTLEELLFAKWKAEQGSSSFGDVCQPTEVLLPLIHPEIVLKTTSIT